jgi:uncharacterized protein YlzI (FlbEa/FlbD family)
VVIHDKADELRKRPMTRAIEVRNPPSFVVVSGPDGQLWLNAHRILSMREDRQGTHIEMDNGETFHVAEKAAVIAEYVQRPTVTVVADPPDEEPTGRRSRK